MQSACCTLCIGLAVHHLLMQVAASASKTCTALCTVLLGLLCACSSKRAASHPKPVQETRNQRWSAATIQPPPDSEVVAVFLPDQTVELAASISAPVLSLHAQLGDEVNEGALLVQLDAHKTQAELREQQAALQLLQTECELRSADEVFATKLHRRSAAAQQSGGVSEAEVERTEQESIRSAVRSKQCLQDIEQKRSHLLVLQAEIDRAYVRAPFHGQVAALYVSKGAMTQSAQPLLRLVGAGPQLVRIAVPASLPVRNGQPLFLRSPQHCWSLQVLRVAPSVDDALGQRVIEARLQHSHTPPSLLYVRAVLGSSCEGESRS